MLRQNSKSPKSHNCQLLYLSKEEAASSVCVMTGTPALRRYLFSGSTHKNRHQSFLKNAAGRKFFAYKQMKDPEGNDTGRKAARPRRFPAEKEKSDLEVSIMENEKELAALDDELLDEVSGGARGLLGSIKIKHIYKGDPVYCCDHPDRDPAVHYGAYDDYYCKNCNTVLRCHLT